MIDALIGGRIYGAPQQRTAKNGSRFITARVRVPTRDGNTPFVNVIAFSETVIAALLTLHDGDSIALTGELTARAFTDRDGNPAPSLDLLAHQVVTPYQVKRKREGNGGATRAQQQESTATARPAAAAEGEFDDEIPF